jgi:RNA polymerase primary sigma factor
MMLNPSRTPRRSTLPSNPPARRGSKGPAGAALLDTYFRAIHQTPLLTAQEEKELAYRIQDGDSKARDQMARANLRLVVKIARQYVGLGLDLPDLIEEGNIGLLRAVDCFDPAMETRFSTYASFWIKQSIRRALKYTARTIRIPSYMVELLIKWRRTANRVQDELGRRPTPEEIAQSMGIPRKKLAGIAQAIRAFETAPRSDRDRDKGSLEETIMDIRTGDVDKAMVDAEERHRAVSLLEKLDPREATVLRMRFGLEDEKPSTLREIGARLGLTRERVRQLQAKALQELGQRLQYDQSDRRV